MKTKKGFGRRGATSSDGSAEFQDDPVAAAAPFASWEVGVQKMAWRWMWNFGDEIRQIVDVGRGSMGAPLAAPLRSSRAGVVCVNEGLSRRIPKEERMVYVDWEGDNVGFLVGSVAIQVSIVQ